jgi:hypothetical protein
LRWILILAAFGSTGFGPETHLHLKTRPMSLMELLGERQAGLPKRRLSSRLHILLQFQGRPQEAQVLELKSRGATIVGYVPDSGIIVAADERTPLDGIGLVSAGALGKDHKLSAELDARGTSFVVEFHPDVEAADVHALVRENGLEEHYHPDLLPHHALVYGTMEAASRLAEWDEVAYVYPAGSGLLNGTRVYSCPGPLTPYGQIGQYIAIVGDGWDGSGQGSADLGYYFGQLATRVPRPQAQAEILRALGEWSKYVQVNFQPAASPNSQRTVSILFASGAHGDPYPFDGPGNVLAHTFYPAPTNPEPIAGDMHFDDSESWAVGQDVDVFSVALHEAGHALGLGHSDKPGAVMYPYYTKVTGLTADDIAAIRQLYASRDGSAEPPASPDPPPPDPPKPPANPPANPPVNPKPPQAPDPPAVDTVAPSVKIVSPANTSVLTSSASMVFSGIASDNVGVVKVTWTDSLGNTGLASGTSRWQTAGVPLRVGSNTITIRAYDAAGNSAWRSVMVTRSKR